MNLEKNIKTSFENFEPEVDSSLWQRIEQGLPNNVSPSDPTNAATSTGHSVLKSLLTQFNPWIWVAGIVATTVVVIAVLNNKQTNSINVQPVQQTVNEKNMSPAEADNRNNIKLNNNAETQADKEATGGMYRLQQENKRVKNESTANETKAAEDNEVFLSPAVQKSNPSLSANEQDKKSTPLTNESNNNSGLQQTSHQTNQTTATKVTEQPSISLNTQIGFAPLKVTATLNNPDLSANWDFGDDQPVIKENSVTHTFTSQGNYKVVCTLDDKTIEKDIEVIGSVSTGFSPNNDGINDEFYVESNRLRELNIKFINRSGKLVFEITQPGQRWDGKDNRGENLPEGTYFYNIFARSISGQPINQKGTISIFR